ncbi:hypothetical protein [Ureibacillus thermosphaericus]|uniref:hypothetical protein n=1 Tax=Ureibacillus thermosphaericus TaxID=51173 RepID=UPI001696BBBA|nr:hypothetical protein [Lysinibacillus sp.]
MKNIYEKLNDSFLSLYVNVKHNVSNEDGVSTVEWVALAALMLTLLLGLAAALKEGDLLKNLAQTVVGKIAELINDVKGSTS